MKAQLKFVSKLLCAIVCTYSGMLAADPATAAEHRYIVQDDSATSAAQAVLRAGGEVKRELNIIKAVSALLSEREAQILREAGLRLTADQPITSHGRRKG